MRQSTLLTIEQLARHWHDEVSSIEALLEEGRAPKHITLPNGKVLFRYADVVTWEYEHE
jgi:hypothetical protein